MQLRKNGKQLDAEFDVEHVAENRCAVVLQARSGNRNRDYGQCLTELLRGVWAAGGTVNRITVDSRPALLLPLKARTLPLPYPLRPPRSQGAFEELRLELGRLQLPIAQQAGARGGNSTKKLRIEVDRITAVKFLEHLNLVRQAFLVTWNPTGWSWASRDNDITAIESGHEVDGGWSTGSRAHGIHPGDEIFLLRQGSSKRGIIGYGVAVGDSSECCWEGPHWDEKRAANGDTANYVDIRWNVLVDDENRITVERLLAECPEVKWNQIYGSGRQIPTAVAKRLVSALDALSTSPSEEGEARRSMSSSAGRASKGQGFGLTSTQRTAVERHAMKLAHAFLVEQGWTEIDDTSLGHPYDFHCRKGSRELFVEVKGTTSKGTTVNLTRGEVEHHHAKYPDNALVIVAGITLGGTRRESASGGRLTCITPWDIKDSALKVVGYTYDVPGIEP